jgi:hypothetical protein
MRVTFVRTFGMRDRVYVAFPEGTEKSWAFPTYGENLPHDLVHLIVLSRSMAPQLGDFGSRHVERAFSIEDGVWGHVARGGELGKTEPLLVAEIFANAPWLRPEEGDVIEYLERELGKLGRALPSHVTREGIDAVRVELARASENWRALADRGALAFEFP